MKGKGLILTPPTTSYYGPFIFPRSHFTFFFLGAVSTFYDTTSNVGDRVVPEGPVSRTETKQTEK